MTAAARNKALASQARRVYIDAMARGMTRFDPDESWRKAPTP